MKYIIEIEDEPLVRKSALHGEDAVYRAKGFKSLVFDKAGLEKLKKYDPFIDRQSEIKYEQEKAYKKGLTDAWSLAQKLDDFLSPFSYDEIFEKMQNYKAKKHKQELEQKILDDFCDKTGYSISELSEIIKRFQE